MSRPPERLYPLLPSLYRARDAATPGQPLRAFVGLIDEQLQLLEADIAGLYENWFIETCADWVVPYIGDLLAVRGLNSVSDATRTQRAVVAHTIAYRRRKGTAAALEKLAQDVTGWPAHVVEYFQLLATTANVNHPRGSNIAFVDLRDTASLEALGSAFETAAHTPEVRHIASARGRYDIPWVGIHLWRLLPDYATWVPAARAAAGKYHLHPLGYDVPMFNVDRTISDFAQRSREQDVPAPLRRRPLYDELQAWRASLATNGTALLSYFRPASDPATGTPDPSTEPVVRIVLDGTELRPEEIEVCDLSGDPSLTTTWKRPDATTYTRADGSTYKIRASFDPRVGRLALANGEADPTSLQVCFATGFPARLGGGFYPRADAVPASQTGVTPLTASGGGAALVNAMNAWAALPTPATGKNAVITITDSETYDVAAIAVPANSSLVICTQSGQRPLLNASATWTIALAESSSFALSGVLVAGAGVRFAVSVAELAATASIEHCTLVPGALLSWDGKPEAPGAPSIDLDPASTGALSLSIAQSISGPIAAAGGTQFSATVTLSDAVVDAMHGSLTALACDTANVVRTTVFGATRATVLSASDSIFTDIVVVQRTQEGCVRFCYVPDGSAVPRAYRCQPSYALGNAQAAGASATDLAQIAVRIVPTFTSTRYGTPAYAQLHDACAPEIVTGASDESEMGVYASRHNPQRVANLRASMDEYLPFGLEAGFFYAT